MGAVMKPTRGGHQGQSCSLCIERCHTWSEREVGDRGYLVSGLLLQAEAVLGRMSLGNFQPKRGRTALCCIAVIVELLDRSVNYGNLFLDNLKSLANFKII